MIFSRFFLYLGERVRFLLTLMASCWDLSPEDLNFKRRGWVKKKIMSKRTSPITFMSAISALGSMLKVNPGFLIDNCIVERSIGLYSNKNWTNTTWNAFFAEFSIEKAKSNRVKKPFWFCSSVFLGIHRNPN